MAAWSARDIPDCSGTVAVVTGANSGIGYITALELARHGAQVILACRNADRGQAAVQRVEQAVPGASVELRLLDTADLNSVRSFSSELLRDHPRVDLLVNNAGVMATPSRATSPQGFELQLATNHLGHFALTGLLLPALTAASAARVITVTSGVHHGGRIDFDDLHAERHYQPWRAYAQSKLANLLFAFELDRRTRTDSRPLVSVAAHPGFARTNLQWAGPRATGTTLQARGLAALTRLVGQSAAIGALPLLYAATAPGVTGGDFYGPGRWGEQRGAPGRARPARQALDRAAAARLWLESERLTGVTYPLGAPATGQTE